MKKTLTVNLGGTVYHIDEDAYVLLDNYLNNLRYHFRKEAGADEIVRDMETRISELFNEYIREGVQVITIEQVEAVIARMGKPEELNAEGEDEQAEKKAEEAKQPKVIHYTNLKTRSKRGGRIFVKDYGKKRGKR